jgi:hypothetical protein
MNPRICICCGEEISEHGNKLSRNPNLCASCSSLADGMDSSGLSSLVEESPTVKPAETASAPPEEDSVVVASRVTP